MIVHTSYWVPILVPGYPVDLGYGIPTEQALQTKLDFRVSSSTECPVPSTYKTWLRAR